MTLSSCRAATLRLEEPLLARFSSEGSPSLGPRMARGCSFSAKANRLPVLFPREKWPPREDFSNVPGEIAVTIGIRIAGAGGGGRDLVAHDEHGPERFVGVLG